MRLASPTKDGVSENLLEMIEVVDDTRNYTADEAWAWILDKYFQGDPDEPTPINPTFRVSSKLLHRWHTRATWELVVRKVASHVLPPELVDNISDYCFDKRWVKLSRKELRQPEIEHLFTTESRWHGSGPQWWAPKEIEEDADWWKEESPEAGN